MIGLLLISACDRFPVGQEEDTATDTAQTTEESDHLPVADVNWNQDGLQLTILNGENHDFYFGLVESTESCRDDTAYGCWTGENCGDSTGYMSLDEEIQLGPYCHPAGITGVNLFYSESIYAVITGNDYVAQGQQTAFPAPTEEESYEFSVTYYLEDGITGECWVWGVDPTVFEERSCKYPLPVAGSDGRARFRLDGKK